MMSCELDVKPGPAVSVVSDSSEVIACSGLALYFLLGNPGTASRPKGAL